MYFSYPHSAGATKLQIGFMIRPVISFWKDPFDVIPRFERAPAVIAHGMSFFSIMVVHKVALDVLNHIGIFEEQNQSSASFAIRSAFNSGCIYFIGNAR